MLLEVRALGKRFGGAVALAGANLAVDAGSVHGLLGENGAGKTTLIKCLAGNVVPDQGEIRIDGAPRVIHSVAEAERLGFRFIHQELNLFPHFDAVENCFVGRPYPHRGPFIDRGAMRRRIATVAREIAPDLPLDVPAGRLTTGQRQLIAIVRALAVAPARLVVMDEPTASLSEGEARRLHQAVRHLAAQDVAVIYISHRLDEVMAICDRYTVLRNGVTMGGGGIADVTRNGLVRLMSGHDEQRREPKAATAAGATVLAVAELPFGSAGRKLSLSVASGEIVGLYGMIGSGRSALLKTIWGAHTHPGGSIAIDGRALQPGRIGARIAAGAAYVPEDRRTEGLLTRRSIADNLALADLQAVRALAALPFTSLKRLAARALDIKARLGIKMGSPFAGPLTLSGGNQQKLLFGRWLGRPLRVLLLDEPTRGVDVGAKEEIHAVVRALARDGAAVLMATSDIEELLALADRIVVLAKGDISAQLVNSDLPPSRVVAAAFNYVEEEDSAA
jgi:ABC-type sugar transport system ATPase subunit